LNELTAPASAIMRAAISSRSPVVTPGRSSAWSTSRMPARIRPAARIESISAGRLIVTAELRVLTTVTEPR
jgi:hypothetical protein